MPHSLRVKIKKLRYKEVITDKDCDRLIMALDNMDTLDKIRAEIMSKDGLEEALEIIDKHRAESEVKDDNIC